MRQLGNAAPRLIAAVAATSPQNGPLLFAKWDIKDGFWCMVVNENDAWNFCFVLPALPGKPPQIVVQCTLPMGWCKSPPFFSTASETARDAAQQMINNTSIALPKHPLEDLCMPCPNSLPVIKRIQPEKLAKLLEVYVDNFIGMMQAPTKQELRHFTRAVLHGIHQIFPPPQETGIKDDKPISMKKLQLGDRRWTSSKEILGWLFDDINRCISLPPEKATKILTILWKTARQKHAPLKQLQKLQGKLMHASLCVPNGKALLSPLIALVAKGNNKPNAYMKLDKAMTQALRDWHALLKTATAHPTPCLDLVPADPDYGGYCNISKLGAGGYGLG